MRKLDRDDWIAICSMAALVLIVAQPLPAAFAQSHNQKMLSQWPLLVKINGVVVPGEREFEASAAGKSDAEAEAMMLAIQRPLKIGQSVQLQVELARSGEPTRVVTTDPRTVYVAGPCLTVTSRGRVTAVQNRDICQPGLVGPNITVEMQDRNEPKAWNRVYFVIQ